MIKKEQLIAGETVLKNRGGEITYQGCVGECLFFIANRKEILIYTLDELKDYKYQIVTTDKTVPLIKVVHDFVPVMAGDNEKRTFEMYLVCVIPETTYPYIVCDKQGNIQFNKYAEFI